MEKNITSVPGYTFCSPVVLYGIGVSSTDGKLREAWLLTHHFPVVYRCPDDNIGLDAYDVKGTSDHR